MNIQQYNPHHDDPKEWLNRMITAGAKNRFSGFFIITPDLAAAMLAVNKDNRNLVKNELRRCIDAFESGQFVVNGESIIFSDDGYLNDGQHRLTACVETGVTFETNLVFGVARDTRYTIDTGTVKGAATLLSMNGVPNASSASAALGCYLLYSHDIYHYSATGLISAQDLLEFYRSNSTRVDNAIRVTGTRAGKSMGQSALAAAHMILSSVNPRQSVIFFERLLDGANLTAGDPILALRNKLLTTRTALMRNHVRLEVILRCWNAHRNGVTRVQIRSSDAYPEKIER